ncbi:EamA family transporter [Asticcacaulis solisilvae]|uniref:EamA family transporter n=1 Tax=Asticcacaulis solisilvae TaxID=1217274 RepID=UPI003FD7AB94
MLTKIPRRTLATCAVLISILSVQAGATFGKHLFPIVGAEGTTALRQGFAALILLAIFRPWQNGPARKDWGVLLLYAVIMGVMNLVFYMGIARVPLGIGVAIEFLGPLTVAVLTSRRAVDFIWIACAAAGLVILLPWHGGSGALDPVGVFWCACAAVCWGLYIIVGQRVSDRVHGGKAVALAMAITTVFTLPIGIATAGATLFSGSVLLWGIAVGILSSAIPYTLEMLALKHLPAKTFSLMMSLEPAAGAILAFLIVGEKLTLMQVVAIALVVTASAGSSLTARRATNEAAT